MSDQFNRMIIELRWPLILLALAMIVSGVMVTASWYIEDIKDQGFQQVQNRLRSAQLALNNIRREEADLEAYRTRFEALSEQGIFAQEQRLNWVEYMANLSAKGKLQSLNYEIASQHPISVPSLPQANSIEVLASRIQLKMGFLHEEDLMHVLEDFRQSRSGFYRTEACLIKRKEGIQSTTQTPTVGENIVAECKMRWVTMQSRSGAK